MPRQTTSVNFYKNINLSRDYSNVCDAITLAGLAPYLVFSNNDISVIRHNQRNGSFKIQRTIQELSYINYIALFNNASDRSPIFAFITDINYVTDSVSEVFFEVDLFSSYCQSLDYQDCFISRMTTADDTLYKYLEDEPINGGDYVTNPNAILRNFITSWYYGYTAVTTSSGGSVVATVKNNILTCAQFTGSAERGDIIRDLYEYMSNGYIDNVVDVFQYPSECGTNGEMVRAEYAVALPNTIDGYTPKNRKLFNYPYVRGLIISTNGDSLEVKPEKCVNNEIAYHVDKIVQPINQMVLTLTNYDRLSYNDDKINRLVLTGFPQVTWASDNYKAWLARNKPNIDLQKEQIFANVVGTLGTATIGAMTGGLGLAVAGSTAINMGLSTINSVSALKAQDEAAQIQPKTIHRGGDLGIDVANDKFGFITLVQTIDARRASLIDNYFNAFGYAINKVTYFRPHRARFDYVETRGELFRREADGSGIPNVAVETMNAAANRGLRIWHSISELNRRDLVSVNSIV